MLCNPGRLFAKTPRYMFIPTRKNGMIMKNRSLVRTLIVTVAAVITLTSLSGCVVVPARGYGYGGPVVVHAWVR